MDDSFVGRQPIFDRELGILGYELLFRDGTTNVANYQNEEKATTDVVLNSVLDIGLEKVVGAFPAFINVTRKFLLGEYPILFPPEKVVLELPPAAAEGEDLIQAVRRLADEGYQIALDGVELPIDVDPALLDLIDIVKVNVPEVDIDSLRTDFEQLHAHKVKVIAAKLETQSAKDSCFDLGADYFQGFFFCRPQVVGAKRMPQNKMALIQLLAKLYDPEADLDEVTDLVSKDVGLSFCILRIANSVMLGSVVEVESVRQAVMRLGMRQLRAWVTVISLSAVDDKPRELMLTALQRAKMCELLGEDIDGTSADSMFTVGLFSLLDALMDQPMDAILMNLPLSELVKGAIHSESGAAGTVLSSVKAHERGDWESLGTPELSPAKLTAVWLQAHEWVEEARVLLSAAG